MQEFDAVYRLYFDRVYRFLLGLSGNHHIADELTQETFFRALRRAILELPEDYRDVVLLHIYAELPLKEIAFQKGKSESWGKVTFYRAKQRLNKRLEGFK